ncbi:hypothetical protein CUT44_15355 [Streptomyces carminius]|uniref:Uncharacterized protein n=1 Tax=Streptomyces carminius TaxID=2665496 RepID=A0A2M8LYA8_9ACTN|nr:hypothetical protein [Streptomyces carminius]PJE96931.1 hypothetical protein CUT44_15355 [Streptomyces carminius]
MTSMASVAVLAVLGTVFLALNVLAFRNEPPFWAMLLVCLATYPLGTLLLRLPVFADAEYGTAVDWGVRLVLVSAGIALLSLALGGRRRRAATDAG